MKILDYIDAIAKPVVEIVLRVFGAFGACWGTFSAAEVVREQFFGGSKNHNLMNNPIYSKLALGVSVTSAGLSTYVLVREKLRTNRTHFTPTELEEITVAVPLCSLPDSQQRQQQETTSALDLEGQSDKQSTERSKECPTEVLCRKKL